tara:strand:- start:588 stop:1103 length:516 start_codon:yes stop_codon:yes gene_type:complete
MEDENTQEEIKENDSEKPPYPVGNYMRKLGDIMDEEKEIEENGEKRDYKVGVHQAHCCKAHGCKYGDDIHHPDGCPVVNGKVEQDHPCEECREDNTDLKSIVNKVQDTIEALPDFPYKVMVMGREREIEMDEDEFEVKHLMIAEKILEKNNVPMKDMIILERCFYKAHCTF